MSTDSRSGGCFRQTPWIKAGLLGITAKSCIRFDKSSAERRQEIGRSGGAKGVGTISTSTCRKHFVFFLASASAVATTPATGCENLLATPPQALVGFVDLKSAPSYFPISVPRTTVVQIIDTPKCPSFCVCCDKKSTSNFFLTRARILHPP